MESLTPHRDDLIVIDNMTPHGNNHEGGMAAMLTAGGDISIDQMIAWTHRRRQSLYIPGCGAQTSLWGGSTQTRMSYRDGLYVTPDDSPHNVFERLFGDVGDPVPRGASSAFAGHQQESWTICAPGWVWKSAHDSMPTPRRSIALSARSLGGQP